MLIVFFAGSMPITSVAVSLTSGLSATVSTHVGHAGSLSMRSVAASLGEDASEPWCTASSGPQQVSLHFTVTLPQLVHRIQAVDLAEGLT